MNRLHQLYLNVKKEFSKEKSGGYVTIIYTY